MHQFMKCTCLGAWAGMALMALPVRADQQKIKLAEAPRAVRAAIEGRLPGAGVSSIEKETENGKVVFDVELQHEGRKYEMDILESGTIVEIEKEVMAKDVLKRVRQAVTAKFPTSHIGVVMEVNKVKNKNETPIHYEVDLTSAAGKKMEVIVSLDGKTVKAEKDE